MYTIMYTKKTQTLIDYAKFLYSDINECTEGIPPCLNGATCRNRYGDYDCDCTDGWTNKNCDEGKLVLDTT